MEKQCNIDSALLHHEKGGENMRQHSAGHEVLIYEKLKAVREEFKTLMVTEF